MRKLPLLTAILLLFRLSFAWDQLEPGLQWCVFRSPVYPDSVNACIRVLKVDPRKFHLRALSVSAPGQNQMRSAMEWCKKEGFVAAINAAMYQADFRTSVSLFKTPLFTNNPKISGDKTILAFDRKSTDVPIVKIIDRQCENFGIWNNKYGSFVQSIRMISCTGKNVWSKNLPRWSIASIATDGFGNILLIHAAKPHTVHELANVLIGLPLDIERAMYLEGGSEAQMSVRSGKKEIEVYGEYSGTGYSPVRAPAIPNIIGVVRGKESVR
ncbi:MAG: phosphodiester glycosidase family protein [Fibrobacter sp.]|nr:phosphodiester glycosidase family protein [Fibrobacter sp.]